MTSVQGYGRFRRERPSISLFNSFLSSELKFSEQSNKPSEAISLIAVILATAINIPKYTTNDL